MTPELTPAIIGLLGALLGAFVGLCGVIVSLRHSATQAARATRRDIYTDFLSAAIEMSSLQSRNIRATGEYLELRREIEALSEGNWRSRRIARNVAGQLSDPLEQTALEFEQKLDALLWKAHRLKLVARPRVHEASMYIYDSLGAYLPFYPEDVRQQGRDNFDSGLMHFADVARSDLRSPGRASRRAIVRRHKELHEAVQSLHDQCRILAESEPNGPS